MQKPELESSWIDPLALEIIERLQRAGHTTYLVGGCVRDVLVGIKPKDFDIVTSATPEEVRKRIPAAYIIGKRFRLVLVRRGVHQFEVSTFRREAKDGEISEEDTNSQVHNIFGTPEEDALRRDFTINALFLDPTGMELIDFVGGLSHIRDRKVHMIGEPLRRMQEDPIRSLRALRLSHRIDFELESSLRNSILEIASRLPEMPLPRRREEYLKILRLKDPGRALCEMFDLDLMKYALPSLHQIFQNSDTRDQFLFYYSQFPHAQRSSDAGPVHLVLPLVLSWIQSQEKSAPELEKEIEEFFKSEFGLFRTEAMDVWKVIEVMGHLHATQQFEKRGERRKKNFLTNPLVPVALDLAVWSHRLSPSERRFWTQHIPRF